MNSPHLPPRRRQGRARSFPTFGLLTLPTHTRIDSLSERAVVAECGRHLAGDISWVLPSATSLVRTNHPHPPSDEPLVESTSPPPPHLSKTRVAGCPPNRARPAQQGHSQSWWWRTWPSTTSSTPRTTGWSSPQSGPASSATSSPSHLQRRARRLRSSAVLLLEQDRSRALASVSAPKS